MKCQRCLRGEEDSCPVRSDIIDMKVCPACADEARSLGLAVEVLGGGGNGDGEKKDREPMDHRSELSACCGR